MAPRTKRQACINCRRKKTRCPGERPHCSSCARLSQQCSYFAVEVPGSTQNSIGMRLRHTDHYLTGILDEPGQGQALETPDSNDNDTRRADDPLHSARTVSENLVEKALTIYFDRFHRQPLCVLDKGAAQALSNIPQELFCALLALVSPFLENQDHESRLLVARKTIMDRTTTSSVDLDTIRSIALIAFIYLRDGDLASGQFHISLGMSLCKFAALDRQSTYDVGRPANEAKRSIFWTLRLLDQYYGSQSGYAQIPERTWPISRTDNRGQDVVQLFSDPTEPTDIWKHSLEIAAIWSRIRHYVLEAMANEIIEPWHRESSYVQIVADMTELETALPMCHRYDSAKFFQQNPQELQDNQDYWGPWLLIQFTYHAAQITLNHPFLYLTLSLRNPNFAKSNTFWKRSMELVVLHSTWIARMIDMVNDKGVRLSDPFFACVAALAGTVHMYYSCAPDQRLAAKSRTDLTKCRVFLKQFTQFSRFCKFLEQRLDRLIDTTFSYTTGSSQNTPTKLHLEIQSIREIMSLICQHRSAVRSVGLLDPSLHSSQHTQCGEELAFEITVATSPEVNVRISDGGQAAPLTSRTTEGDLQASVDSPRNTVYLSNEELFLDSTWDWTLPGFDARSTIPDLANRDLWDPSWWGFSSL